MAGVNHCPGLQLALMNGYHTAMTGSAQHRCASNNQNITYDVLPGLSDAIHQHVCHY